MPYGVRTYDASGNILLDASYKTIRLVFDQTYVWGGVTTYLDINMSNDCNSSNSVAVSDEGARVIFPFTGVVRIYYDTITGFNSRVRVYRI